MAVYLVPVQKGHTIVLDKAVVFVGRHPDCDVVLTHSRKVSRKHCCICQVNDEYCIRDLGSMNGVRVNGKRVRKEARFAFGDEVSIGDVAYTLQKHKAAAPPRRQSGDQPPPRRPESRPQPAPARGRPSPAPPDRIAAPPRRRAEELSGEFPVPVADDGESFAVYSADLDEEESVMTVGHDDLPEAIIVDDDSVSGSDIQAIDDGVG